MTFVCLVLAGLAAFLASRGNWVAWIFAALLVLAIVGLVRRVRWGRRLALGMCWLMILVGFGSVLPPERVDGVAPPPIIAIEYAVTQMVVLCLVGLLCLHLLGRHRKAFRDTWF